jgi:uncharacterized RDD family membrane protein YckC
MSVIRLSRPSVVLRSPAYASLECRFGAYLIDTALFLFVQSFILYFLMDHSLAESNGRGFLLTQFQIFPVDPDYLSKLLRSNIYFILLHWLYYATMEASHFQGTIGKLVLGMKVTGMDGHRIHFLQASLRYFGKYLSVGVLFMGFFIALFGFRHQTLHDLIAGCTVKLKRIKKG